MTDLTGGTPGSTEQPATRVHVPLAVKVTAAFAVWLLLLGTAVYQEVTSGFMAAQRGAASTAGEGVSRQVKLRLMDLTQREARLAESRLQRAASATRSAVSAWPSLLPTSRGKEFVLSQTPLGVTFDPSPQRISDVYLPVQRLPDARSMRDIQDSGALDALLPVLLRESPDVVAMYFVSTQGLTRYVPPLGLQDILVPDLDVTKLPLYQRAVPARNPERLTIWSPPYVDDSVNGLLVTTSSPAYLNSTFRGVISADISLARLSERLETLKPTPGSAAMLLDSEGHVLVASDELLQMLLGDNRVLDLNERLSLSMFTEPRSPLRALQAKLTRDASGIERVATSEATLYVSFASLPDLEWTLLVFAPQAEVAAQVAAVSNTINRNAALTLDAMVLMLAVFLVTGAVGGALLLHLGLTRPLRSLTRAAHAVTAGDLGVRLQIRTRDELQTLAETVNVMLNRLQARGIALRQSEERYALAVKGSNDGLWDWNIPMSDLYLSARWKDILGYQVEDLPDVLQSFEDLLHPEERDHVMRTFDAFFASSDELLELEHRLRHQDGTFRHVLLRGALRRDEQGAPLRFAGSLTDITDRVMAYQGLERRVEERTRELEALLSVTRDLAFTPTLTDTLGNLASAVCRATFAVASAVVLSTGRQGASFGGASGLPDHFDPASFTVRAGGQHPSILERTVDRGGPLVLSREEASADPILPSSWSTLISVPLVVRGHFLGLLLTWFAHDTPVGASDVHLLEGIARQAAVAVQNAHLFATLQEQAAHAERHKLARELHDSVSQALYGIALGGRTTLRLLERTPDKAPDSVRYMLTLAEAALAEMRALIFELRPESLEQEGLSMALSKLASVLRARHGLHVSLDLCEEPNIALDVKVALLRIAQEATHNIVKHASATNVELRLAQEEGHVLLDIHDDGQGFDMANVPGDRLGRKTMRERALAVHGDVTIHSAAQEGTQVHVRVPRTRH